MAGNSAEKIDVLDLLINSLREHEAELDQIVTRFSGDLSIFERLMGHTIQEQKLQRIIDYAEQRLAVYQDSTYYDKELVQEISEDLAKIIDICGGAPK